MRIIPNFPDFDTIILNPNNPYLVKDLNEKQKALLISNDPSNEKIIENTDLPKNVLLLLKQKKVVGLWKDKTLYLDEHIEKNMDNDIKNFLRKNKNFVSKG